MDPNSSHQIWSLWTWNVEPAVQTVRPFLEVRDNIARFARKGFGSPTQLRLSHQPPVWIVEIMTEGAPVQDEGYVQFMSEQFERFFRSGFGPDTTVQLRTKLLAGSAGDGRPADQLIILPALERDDGESVI